MTTGNHALYDRLERELARAFRAERAVLVNNGYLTNLAVAQALQGEFTHVLMDARSHLSLADAATLVGAPVVSFAHRDAADLRRKVLALGRSARPLLMTDGMFSHDGSVAPLAEYLAILPETAALLVDDAHAAGVLGEGGRGTASHCGVRDARLIQTITLSKALGAAGGAILGSRFIAEAIVTRSRCFTGATPVALPLAAGALAAVQALRAHPEWQRRLRANAEFFKSLLRAGGVAVPDAPGPIVALVPESVALAKRLQRRLLAAGIFPPLIRYPGGPAGGYFRFVISSAHTRRQLGLLAAVLTGK